MRVEWIALATCVASFVGSQLATGLARAEGPVPHEFVSAIEADEAERALGLDLGGASDATHEDAARPAAMVATPGDGIGQDTPGRRSPMFLPDRETQLEGTLEYQEPFTPAIAPFKRVTSLDRVRLAEDGITPVLVVSAPERSVVPIGEAPLPDDVRPRDRFAGEVTLDFRAGRVLPLPSVAPESRILSVETEPAIQIAIERDGADNFFAVAHGKLPASEVHLSFVTDAPRAYFGGSIPTVPLSAFGPEALPLPASVRARGLQFAAELGVGPRSDLASALSALTAHFRAFEASAQRPADRGDIYLELARGMKGICRHRAYAFVVTAHALGIPARFVQNEAHSWVEVKVPRVGFRRIDLGGAAGGLRAEGLDGRSVYEPAEPDRLPRPPAYERSEAIAAREAAERTASARGRWVSDAAGAMRPDLAQLLAAAQQVPDRRATLSLRLDSSDASVLRGRALRVRGRVQDASGAGIPGLRVEVSLSAEQRREHMLLGVTLSDASGAFAGTFDVPVEVEVGEYRLRVVTPGNAQYAPAIAE